MNENRDRSRGCGATPAYLIINADDYGYFDHVSRGILECACKGMVTATGVFANSPQLDEHAAWLHEQPDLDIGVHLNLTDRQPLTRSLGNALDKWNGRFPGKFPIARAILTHHIPLGLIRNEWRAQIERCLASNLKLRFLNSHEHIHMLPSLYPMTLELAHEYGIDHVRFSTPEWPGTWSANALLRDGIMAALSMLNRLYRPTATPVFLGMGESGRISPQYLQRLLIRLKPGNIYELMCHPGLVDNEGVAGKHLRAYHDWDLERRTLIHPRLGMALLAGNIRLIGYRHLWVTRERLHVIEEVSR
jgi:predicted glycoside hydrolase/deacetylase ChbG (UPF0249 family)